MIDVESRLFTIVKDTIQRSYPDIEVSSVPTLSPPSFPFVNFYEADNSTYERTRDSSNKEKYASVMYSLNIYSNSENGKKTEARSIFNLIDEQLVLRGLQRTSAIPIVEVDVYRITARYVGVVDSDFKFYRR